MRNSGKIPSFKDLIIKFGNIFDKWANPRKAMRSYRSKASKLTISLEQAQEVSNDTQKTEIISENIEHTPLDEIEYFILDLRDEISYQEYCQKVLDISNITEYIRNHPKYHREFINNLEDYQKRMKKTFEKITFSEEEDFTQQVAERVSDVINARLTDTMEGCFVRGHIPDSEREHTEFLTVLRNRIEEYLHNIGISRVESISEESIMDEDDYKYWDKTYYKDTIDEEKNLRYEEISVYPHILHYLNEDEEEDIIYIGGSCVVWKYRRRNEV